MTTYIGRRVVDVRLWHSAKEQFAALTAECEALRRDLANVRRQRDDAIDALQELRAVHVRVEAARGELAALYRERAIARAQAAERDPALPLN
jgi:hypothetical protein